LYTVGRNVKFCHEDFYSLFPIACRFPKKIQNGSTHDPAIKLLGTYAKELKQIY
jgi:hypothetical protein